MPVEAATYITQLDPSQPPAGETQQLGDNYIKGLKQVLLNTFPSLTGAVTATHTELSKLAGVTGTLVTSTSYTGTLLTTTSNPMPGRWTLIGTTTVTGTPSTVDFVNGTGGVVLSTDYDEFMVEFDNISCNNTTDFRMLFSTNAGATWTNIINMYTVYSNIVGGVHSAGVVGPVAYYSITGGQTASGATGNTRYYLSGNVVIKQPQFTNQVATVFSECMHDIHSIHRCAAHSGSEGAAITGIRFSFGAGTFETQGRFRVFARRTT